MRPPTDTLTTREFLWFKVATLAIAAIPLAFIIGVACGVTFPR